MGELGLNGEVCPVSGILPVVLEAKREGCRACMVPWDNVKEAEYAGILPVIGVKTLKEAVSFLSPEPRWKTVSVTGKVSVETSAYTGPDFRDIRGQQEARRAAEIAVSGFHNLLLIGPPGRENPCWRAGFLRSCQAFPGTRFSNLFHIVSPVF